MTSLKPTENENSNEQRIPIEKMKVAAFYGSGWMMKRKKWHGSVSTDAWVIFIVSYDKRHLHKESSGSYHSVSRFPSRLALFGSIQFIKRNYRLPFPLGLLADALRVSTAFELKQTAIYLSLIE